MTALIVILMVVVFVVALAYQVSVSKAKAAAGVIASFGDLNITATELIEGSGSTAPRYPLAGLTARVEDSGTLNRRITATRLAVMGPFALAAKKKQDDREVYLTIEGPDVAILRTVQFKNKPRAGTEAREFAAQLNLRSRQLAGVSGGAPDGEAAPAAPADGLVTVTLQDPGANPILVIKAVRELVHGLGLKDAKDLVEHTPAVLLSKVDSASAAAAVAKLQRAGAQVAALPTSQ